MAESVVHGDSTTHVTHTWPVGAVDSQGRVLADVRCSGCGYDLRSQHADGHCSECGAAIADMLSTKSLAFSPPRAVFTVVIGARLLIVAWIMWLLATAINFAPVLSSLLAIDEIWALTAFAVSGAHAALFLAGAWAFTWRTDPSESIGRASFRWCVRILALLSSAFSVLLYYLMYSLFSSGALYFDYSYIEPVSIAVQFAGAASGGTLLWYFRMLASRMSSPRLTRWSTILFVVGLAASIPILVLTTTRFIPDTELVYVLAFGVYLAWIAAEFFYFIILIAMTRGLRTVLQRARHNAELAATPTVSSPEPHSAG